MAKELEDKILDLICASEGELSDGFGYYGDGGEAGRLAKRISALMLSEYVNPVRIQRYSAMDEALEPDDQGAWVKWEDVKRLIVETSTNAAPQAAEQRGPENNPLVIPAEAACVSVPKQPTEDMVASGVHAILRIEGEQAPTRVRVVYRAMLNARPISPETTK